MKMSKPQLNATIDLSSKHDIQQKKLDPKAPCCVIHLHKDQNQAKQIHGPMGKVVYFRRGGHRQELGESIKRAWGPP